MHVESDQLKKLSAWVLLLHMPYLAVIFATFEDFGFEDISLVVFQTKNQESKGCLMCMNNGQH